MQSEGTWQRHQDEEEFSEEGHWKYGEPWSQISQISQSYSEVLQCPACHKHRILMNLEESWSTTLYRLYSTRIPYIILLDCHLSKCASLFIANWTMRSFGAAWKEGDVIGILFSAKDLDFHCLHLTSTNLRMTKHQWRSVKHHITTYHSNENE